MFLILFFKAAPAVLALDRFLAYWFGAKRTFFVVTETALADSHLLIAIGHDGGDESDDRANKSGNGQCRWLCTDVFS
jgi:hypothetical protein